DKNDVVAKGTTRYWAAMLERAVRYKLTVRDDGVSRTYRFSNVEVAQINSGYWPNSGFQRAPMNPGAGGGHVLKNLKQVAEEVDSCLRLYPRRRRPARSFLRPRYYLQDDAYRSIAPRSQTATPSPSPSRGRLMPRWSLPVQGPTATSIAGLPGSSGWNHWRGGMFSIRSISVVKVSSLGM